MSAPQIEKSRYFIDGPANLYATAEISPAFDNRLQRLFARVSNRAGLILFFCAPSNFTPPVSRIRKYFVHSAFCR